MLRGYCWLVPAYRMSEVMEDVSVLRFVVRNGFSHDLASMLLEHLRRITDELTRSHPPHGAPAPAPSTNGHTKNAGFHH